MLVCGGLSWSQYKSEGWTPIRNTLHARYQMTGLQGARRKEGIDIGNALGCGSMNLKGGK
jgi:hypothetical protein